MDPKQRFYIIFVVQSSRQVYSCLSNRCLGRVVRANHLSLLPGLGYLGSWPIAALKHNVGQVVRANHLSLSPGLGKSSQCIDCILNCHHLCCAKGRLREGTLRKGRLRKGRPMWDRWFARTTCPAGQCGTGGSREPPVPIAWARQL